VTTRRDFLRAGVAAALLGASGCGLGRAPDGRRRAALWFTYGGRNRQTLERLVRRFNDAQREHFVEAVYQGDYYEGLAKLRTAIAARSAPALSHVIGEVVPYLAEAGVLEPLDGREGASELGIVSALGQAGSWHGGGERPLVALPFNRSTPIAYLNGDLFRRAGLTAPRSWRELRETAFALTRRDKGRTTLHGFGCPVDWWFWVALVGQAGGSVVEPGGAVTLGGPAGVAALEFWQALVTRDGSMKPPPGRDYNAWEQTNQDFIAGRTAMIWTSTAFLRYLEDTAPFPVVAAPLPGHVRRAVPTGGTHWVMLKDAPAAEKETAWAFLRYMHEPAQAIEWATSTGYLPVTDSAVEKLETEGYYQEHPNDRVALDQLGVAMPWPWSTELFRVQREIVQPRLESAVLARRDAEALLTEARREASRRG
jgi:sn-glycerol 3-phosphate transport system substrate-binding protein